MLAFDIEMDECPLGWKDLIRDLCNELALKLEEQGLLKGYKVLQAKEKYGSLRWYDVGGSEETDQIVRKYEELSNFICCDCGEPAEYVSTGYICPYCEKCVEKVDNVVVPIDEFYHFWE